MGKKHKKHKSEKHTHTERPLKLVLKVAGNEVTTGSPSLESIYDDSVDYDKHKDKKKKKKKKDEKDRASPPVSPVDKKKKMTKKRKGPDSVDPDWDEQSRTPARSSVSQDKPLTPSLARTEEKEQTPLQEALSQLIRQLQRKDPSAFFSFPVTDLIAPGYSLIIKRPMDFSTMKEKVKKEQYQSLEELKLDFKVMCENAMIYNKPETIYYKAAKKLLHSGMKILSKERLESLKQSIEFMAGLQPSSSHSAEDGGDEGGTSDAVKENSFVMDTSDNSQSPRVGNKDTPRDSKDDAQKSQAEKDQEEIKKIVEESGGKLSNRSLQCELEFERRKADGSTTLGILNPADLSAGDPGYCPVKLGMMGGRLQTGINTLQGFKEDKRNMVTPVESHFCISVSTALLKLVLLFVFLEKQLHAKTVSLSCGLTFSHVDKIMGGVQYNLCLNTQKIGQVKITAESDFSFYSSVSFLCQLPLLLLIFHIFTLSIRLLCANFSRPCY
uniref:Bromodomain-containing protein 7-like n=1 Tax=Cyprinus carpio TaxID=7962 RepID=A0A8C1QCL8_CYPCA